MKPKALVVVDIQKEYVTEGRPFNIRSIGPSLKKAAQVLLHARQNDWPTYHIRHLQGGSIFSRDNEYSQFVPGFEPRAGEVEIHKSDFSCYSAPEFVREMQLHRNANTEVVIIGYGATMCCISTIIDGYHRGQKLAYVRDASNAKASATFGEESLHAHATDIISTYARVTTAEELMQES